MVFTRVGALKASLGLILWTSSLSFFACEEELPRSDPPYHYPLKLGNYWVYNRVQTALTYSDSGKSARFDDTLIVQSSISVTVSYQGLWGDSLEYSVLNSYCRDGCEDHTAWHYYTQNDSGLFLFGYESPVNVIAPKITPHLVSSLGGKTFISNDAFFIHSAPAVLPQIPVSDSIYIENPMVRVLEYPLHQGASWTYRDSGNPWRMDREVVFSEELMLENDSFLAFEIVTHYDKNHDGVWDEDLYIKDHFAAEGLVRREIFMDSIFVMSEDGSFTKELKQLVDVYELSRYRLN